MDFGEEKQKDLTDMQMDKKFLGRTNCNFDGMTSLSNRGGDGIKSKYMTQRAGNEVIA